jgi:hypothetical protein
MAYVFLKNKFGRVEAWNLDLVAVRRAEELLLKRVFIFREVESPRLDGLF